MQGNEGSEGDAKELQGGVVVEMVELHDPLAHDEREGGGAVAIGGAEGLPGSVVGNNGPQRNHLHVKIWTRVS